MEMWGGEKGQPRRAPTPQAEAKKKGEEGMKRDGKRWGHIRTRRRHGDRGAGHGWGCNFTKDAGCRARKERGQKGGRTRVKEGARRTWVAGLLYLLAVGSAGLSTRGGGAGLKGATKAEVGITQRSGVSGAAVRKHEAVNMTA